VYCSLFNGGVLTLQLWSIKTGFPVPTFLQIVLHYCIAKQSANLQCI